MMQIKVEVRGVKETINRMKLANAQVADGTINATHRAMDKMVENANKIVYQDYHTYSHGHSTAPIEESWVHEKGKFYNTYGYVARLKNVALHASAVEFGVPHTIYPKHAKKLHLGNNVFKASVPGQEGKFYLTKSINQSDDYFDIYQKEIRKIIGGL